VHIHTFTAAEGGTRVDDVVEYQLPFGPLGRLVHGWLVGPELDRIFAHRRHAIDAIFEPVTVAATASAKPGVVAVAGGTGFVGGAIARELRRRGRTVVVLSSRGEAARGELPDDIEIRHADVRTGAGLAEALRSVDELVISLGFPGSPIERPKAGATFMEVDAAGTERLVAAANVASVGRLVYISGAGAAPDAPRHWFRAKWRAEEAVRASGLTWTVIRPTWIYGPGDVALNRFLGFGRLLPFVPMTSFGRQQLAPVFIDDAAKLAADSLEAAAAANQIFELGGPETMSMREIIRRALRVAGLRRPIMPAPAALMRLVAVPMQLLPNPLLTPHAVTFINQPATVDLAPLQARMPRRLTPLVEGLATYLGPAAQ
jgi:NADH dehydrogenase